MRRYVWAGVATVQGPAYHPGTGSQTQVLRDGSICSDAPCRYLPNYGVHILEIIAGWVGY